MKDHQQTQAILQKALDRMNQKYSNMKVKYALAQDQPGADFSPIDATVTDPGSGPVKFTNAGKTEHNKGGNQVIELLKGIQKDSADAETAATQSEKDAQANYEVGRTEEFWVEDHVGRLAMSRSTWRKGWEHPRWLLLRPALVDCRDRPRRCLE